ncbi:MAG: hypothetical protein RLZZ435_2034 [Cyanobacteriota bacterium]
MPRCHHTTVLGLLRMLINLKRKTALHSSALSLYPSILFDRSMSVP